jgi:hypothetical protein
VTVNTLSRLVAPSRSDTSPGRTPIAPARAFRTASVALPSTAGAPTATISAGPCGPSYRPPTRVRPAPGRTRTGTDTPAGR